MAQRHKQQGQQQDAHQQVSSRTSTCRHTCCYCGIGRSYSSSSCSLGRSQGALPQQDSCGLGAAALRRGQHRPRTEGPLQPAVLAHHALPAQRVSNMLCLHGSSQQHGLGRSCRSNWSCRSCFCLSRRRAWLQRYSGAAAAASALC